jgi:LEA14-like dessication related protein
MNKRKIIYISSAIAIAIVAGVTYWGFASNNENVERQAPAPTLRSPSNLETQSTDRTDNPIVISIKNVTVAPIDSSHSNLQITFDAHNPNRGTIILESIQYKVLINNSEIASGEIGERLEGFLESQDNVFPVIASGNVTLKDTDQLARNSENSDIWNRLSMNQIESYQVNGTYSFSQTSTLQASGGDRPFTLSFP